MVWAVPRSLATTCGITFVFFSYGYLDVSVPHVRLPYGMTGLLPAGLPHSEILGSKVICTYPKLIAAYHVLHRLREPRHPPSALAYFLYHWHCFLFIAKIEARVGLIYLQLALFFCYFTFLKLSNTSKIFFYPLRSLSWRITDSNRWPSACKADALASWANPPFFNW